MHGRQKLPPSLATPQILGDYMSVLIPNSSSYTSLDVDLVVNEKESPPSMERRKSQGDQLSLPLKAWYWMCLLLHIVLVLLHVSLFVTGWYHKEQNIIFDIQNKFETLTARLLLVLQAFVTVYTTILVALLQSLSLRNELCRLQTLTATSDKTRSWSGLGSAVYILWQQLFIYASKGTLAITAYLTLIIVLHNTTPAVIGLELFNATVEVRASTIGGFPDGHSDLWLALTNTATFIPLLGTASDLTYRGLYNNTLHEVVQHPGVGTATVNATTFDVSCGVINNLNDPAPYLNESESESESGSWALYQNNSAALITMGALRIRACQTCIGRCYLYASTNVTDSEGTAGPQVSLSPPMYPKYSFKPSPVAVDTLSVFGCSLSWFSQKAVIDTATNLVISLEKPSWKTFSKWQEWKEEAYDATQVWFPIVGNSPIVPAQLRYIDFCTNYDASESSLIDQYLMSKLGLLVKNGTERCLSFNSVLLHDVENALARIIAAAVWAAAQFESPKGTVGQTLFPRGTTTIQKPVLRARFKMNMTIVAIGMGSSAVMVVLAFFLSRNGETHETPVDTIGVLELLWVYSRNRQEALELMDDVDEPTIDNLRKAGLVEMRLVDGVNSCQCDDDNTV